MWTVLRLRTVIIAAIVCWALVLTADACNVPVFRYALERWRPDPFVIYVVHQGPLSESDEQQVQQLRRASLEHGGRGNLVLKQCDVSGEVSDPIRGFLDAH